MRRLNFLVEGQTEEGFVWELLVPHLTSFGIVCNVNKLITSRGRVYQPYGNRQSRVFKGGLISHQQAKNDLKRWLLEDNTAVYTTMFDLYALPDDFPMYQETQTLKPYQRVEQLEQAFFRDLGQNNVIPYFQLHEFEALLFSDVTLLNSVVGLDEIRPDKTLVQLEGIRSEFETPELINDSPHTAPSKRLAAIFSRVYNKPRHALQVAQNIGLARIRSECPHFDAWITKLENLG